MNILVINAGSSSLKYQLIEINKQTVLAKGLCERIGIEGSKLKHSANDNTVVIEKELKDHAEAIKAVIAALVDTDHGVIKSMDEIAAVGHRVVHGGEKFKGSVIIDEDVKKAIEDCIELAPLHNPPNLTGIMGCEVAMPGIPMVAVFDTAFHQTMPEKAYLYGIPYEYYEKYKIRKYGFHGTSHKYVAQRAAKMLGKKLEDTKIITLHLGNGSSVAAIDGGKSVDTSMGFTPLAGVLMGTRSGTIDPAIVTYIMEKENIDFKQANNILNKESGVLGISGVSSDFRDVEMAAKEGNRMAALALDMFMYDVKKFLGKYLAVLGGADAIVFTAGIGENNFMIRAGVVENLETLGIAIDLEKNSLPAAERDVSAPNSKIKTLVIPTNEELMIALETKELI